MAKITFIARMTCKPGKRAEFIRLCRQLEDHVRSNEPDTLAYEFFKLREENQIRRAREFSRRSGRAPAYELEAAGRDRAQDFGVS